VAILSSRFSSYHTNLRFIPRYVLDCQAVLVWLSIILLKPLLTMYTANCIVNRGCPVTSGPLSLSLPSHGIVSHGTGKIRSFYTPIMIIILPWNLERRIESGPRPSTLFTQSSYESARYRQGRQSGRMIW
jgi:hypothetical protein